jgi:hypothetical protein
VDLQVRRAVHDVDARRSGARDHSLSTLAVALWSMFRRSSKRALSSTRQTACCPCLGSVDE